MSGGEHLEGGEHLREGGQSDESERFAVDGPHVRRRWLVDGNWRDVQVAALEPVLRVLRTTLGITGPKEGCGEGECGACTVLVDSQPVLACILPAGAIAHGSTIETITSVASTGLGQRITSNLVSHGAVQCGACMPGIVVSAYAHLRECPETSERDIREALAGNLCRCTGYTKIISALLAAGRTAGDAAFVESRARSPEGVAAESSGAGADFYMPRTLARALAYRARHPGCLILAGGTDLLVTRNCARKSPLDGRAISDPTADASMRGILYIGALPELREIRLAGGSLVIGAGVTAATIATDANIGRHAPALRAAAQLLGSAQVRSRATIGGNIGNASPAADLVPPLLAAGAEVRVASASGERVVPLERFFCSYRTTDLGDDEILTEIRVPFLGERERQGFRKLGARRGQSIAKVCVAARGEIEGDVIRSVRIAAGSVAATPVLLSQTAGRLIGSRVDSTLRDRLREWVAADVSTIDDVRSTADYRREMCAVLVADVLEELAGL